MEGILANKREWSEAIEGTDVSFIEKIGDYIYCEKFGFIFKIHRSCWPIKRFSPNNCVTPNEFFKFQVRQLHGDLYNLNKTIYSGADNKVVAECKIHGEFSIEAKYLKSKRGCPACGDKSAADSNRLTTQEFINKARLCHGETYDYSSVDYIDAKTHVKIVCRDHGEFRITPSNHLNGKGCKLCANIRIGLSRALSQEDVITRFINKHGYKYDYSLVEYKGDAHGHLSIICKEHGVFEQSYANHNSGKGCPTCAKEFNPKLKMGFLKSANKKGYASLYLIRCYNENENFYKIGITTKSINSRFSGIPSMPYNFELLRLYWSDGDTVWDMEKLLHREYREVKYVPNIHFGGMYECFSEINVDEYDKLMSVIA